MCFLDYHQVGGSNTVQCTVVNGGRFKRRRKETRPRVSFIVLTTGPGLVLLFTLLLYVTTKGGSIWHMKSALKASRNAAASQAT